jgi:hypothetical protein
MSMHCPRRWRRCSYARVGAVVSPGSKPIRASRTAAFGSWRAFLCMSRPGPGRPLVVEFVGGGVADEFGKNCFWPSRLVVAVPACGWHVVSRYEALGVPIRDAESCESFNHRCGGGGKGQVCLMYRGTGGLDSARRGSLFWPPIHMAERPDGSVCQACVGLLGVCLCLGRFQGCIRPLVVG